MNRWAAIARFGGIGDNLIAGSPLMALKKMGYMTEVITGAPAHQVFLHNPHIDKLSIKKTEDDLPQGDLFAWQKWFDARSREYDLFSHASHSCEGRHAIFKTMTAFWWPAEVRRKVCAGSYLETAHDLLGAPYDFGPLYFASEEEHHNALQTKEKIGERFILWVLSGTRVDKVYPAATYAVARIIRELKASVVLMGGPSEKERFHANLIKEVVEIQNGTRDGLHIAIPENDGDRAWPLRASLALALTADLVVTPDTGTAWAVAMEQMPKVMLLSHASQENITKHWVNTVTLHADQGRVPCWPCHRLHDDNTTCVPNKENNGAACISDISVDRLLETVARLWDGRNVIPLRREAKIPRVGKVAANERQS